MSRRVGVRGSWRRASLRLGLAVIALVCLVPAEAPAGVLDEPDTLFGFAQPVAEFSLPGSNGYSLKVKAAGGRVALWATRKHQRAGYLVGREGNSIDEIEAQFGGLGRVAVEFQPSSTIIREEKPLPGCTAEPEVTRFGVFVGTIEFTGERGYTKVRQVQARGRTNAPAHLTCESAKSLEPGPPTLLPQGLPEPEEPTLLKARARETDLLFVAFSKPSLGLPDLTVFSAKLNERRGPMRVSRAVFTYSRPRNFVFDEGLTAATVRPPKPFEGTATFQRGSGGRTSWNGSLAVRLPGTKVIALTGSRFRVRLAAEPQV